MIRVNRSNLLQVLESVQAGLSAREVEEWKDIPGFEGCYQASTLGKIRSLDRTIKRGSLEVNLYGKILRPRQVNKYGHCQVILKGKPYSIGYLVLITFVGPRPSRIMQVRHFPDRVTRRTIESPI